MAKDKKTIRFWLRTDRKNQNTTCPLHLVYQIKGVRKAYSIPDTHILAANWDVKQQAAVYCNKMKAKKDFNDDNPELLLMANEVANFNDKIAKVRSQISNIETRFTLDDIQITPELVIDKLKELTKDSTKKNQPGIYVADFISRYCQESTNTHKYRTIQVYEGVATHLKDYESKYGVAATFDNLDIPFLRGFVNYLLESKTITLKPYPNGKLRKPRKVAGMNNITIAKQISTLKTLLKVARSIYKINVNLDYQDFKVTRKDANLEVITLTNEEFLKLYSHDFKGNKTYAQVRDVFCFACATGLRYSDLVQLKREHIRHNTIRMTASKTGQRLDIPLNPYSFAILEKYAHLHHPLPIISGQKTNQYLKKLSKEVGLDAPVEKVREYGIEKEAVTYKKCDLISIHMGRKTFTTLSLEKGIPAQDVMALTGHTTFKSFKRYVDVTNERKKAVMAQAWGEVKDNNLRVVNRSE